MAAFISALLGGIILAVLICAFVIYVVYQLYSGYVKRQTAAGKVSLATIRPIWLSLYCISIWLGSPIVFLLPFLTISNHESIALTVCAFIVSVANLISCWGLWKLTRWGYWMTLTVIFLLFCTIIWQTIQTQKGWLSFLAIGPTCIYVVVLTLYLTRNRYVRAVFGY